MSRLVEDKETGWPGLTALRTLTPLCGGETRVGQPTGVKALMLAVLEDGIRSVLSAVPQIRAEAEYWVLSNQRRSPFSFAIVCESLGLDPSAARRAILAMRGDARPDSQPVRRSRPNVHRRGRLSPSKN